jgi:hypothetical protein
MPCTIKEYKFIALHRWGGLCNEGYRPLHKSIKVKPLMSLLTITKWVSVPWGAHKWTLHLCMCIILQKIKITILINILPMFLPLLLSGYHIFFNTFWSQILKFHQQKPCLGWNKLKNLALPSRDWHDFCTSFICQIQPFNFHYSLQENVIFFTQKARAHDICVR